MARLGPPAETHYTLPADFAAMLGQCVASFGWLEEIIKRTIFALDRARLADDLTPQELRVWLTRMSNIADDSMGTLVEQLDAAMRRHAGLKDRNALTDRLGAIKRQRNLLCHASWRPGSAPGRWHPAFVNTQGETFDQDMGLEDLQAAQAEALAAGQAVLHVLRATGVKGYWAGDDAD